MDKTREKMVKGVLRAVVLKLLTEKPMHGYTIIVAIRERFGIYFGPSTIYPLLANMEREGLIVSQWSLKGDRPRKIYTVTTKGERTLSEETQQMKAIVQPFLETPVISR